jgi:hypothetical protein
LILSAVRFSSSKEMNLLSAPVIVANVLATPTIKTNKENEIYQSVTKELVIQGAGFTGAKKVDLFFEPPLLKEIAYEVVSQFPLAGPEVILRLLHPYQWSETVGPLTLVGVDTGGGPIKLNHDIGVVVADVRPDDEASDVSVEETAADQRIYHDDLTVKITGTGFNTDRATLRFSDNILGNGVNYTMTELTESSITLRLTTGERISKPFLATLLSSQWMLGEDMLL